MTEKEKSTQVYIFIYDTEDHGEIISTHHNLDEAKAYYDFIDSKYSDSIRTLSEIKKIVIKHK